MLLQVRVPWGGNGGGAGAGEPGRAPDGMANPPETKVLAVTVSTDTLDPWRPVGTPGKNPVGVPALLYISGCKPTLEAEAWRRTITHF